jgi:hypothetical protein
LITTAALARRAYLGWIKPARVVCLGLMALFALGLGDPVVASAAWSQPARVSEAGHLSTYPQVGLDRRGDAIAVWMDERGQALNRIMASRRPGSSEA